MSELASGCARVGCVEAQGARAAGAFKNSNARAHLNARTPLRARAWLGIAFCCGWILTFSLARTAAAQTGLEVWIDTPEPEAEIGDLGGMLFVAGKALAPTTTLTTYDVVLVLDRSDSTRESALIDVDGDGEIRRRCDEKPRGLALLSRLFHRCAEVSDSVFRAELASARALLTQLDPRTTRVGLVAFGGDNDPATPDAWELVPLTTDYERIRNGLDVLEAHGPRGLTNLEAAIELAARELESGRPNAPGGEPESHGVMVVFGDGAPTLPAQKRRRNSNVRFIPKVQENRRLAVLAARRAAESAIRIDTFATRLEEPAAVETMVELSRTTTGVFTPLVKPEELQSMFEAVSFSKIEQLTVRNRTSGVDAAYANRDADGRFAALVPLVAGNNTIEVFARTTEGSERVLEFQVHWSPEADPEPLSPASDDLRERLLANWLAQLRRENLALAAERDALVRKGLLAEMERARERARSLRVEPDRGED